MIEVSWLEFEAASADEVTLAGANASQPTAGASGAITQTHLLSGNSAAHPTAASAGATSQTHMLAGNNASQPTAASTGAVSQITPVELAGANASQVNAAATGAVSQTHLLAGNNAAQPNAATAGAVSQVPIATLTGANASQPNASTSGAITQAHILIAAPVAIDHIATSSAIVQTHILSGSSAEQINAATGGRVGDIIWPESSATGTVHAVNTLALVITGPSIAIAPNFNTLAIAPATGDDMEPITTFEQYRQDREFYSIDFNRRYMKSTGDTECTLIAFGSDAGIDVEASVAIGDPVPLGVVTVSVDDPDGPGLYKAWAQVRTGSGRERTGVVLINVEDL
jgi:hypothetical protein